VDVGDHVLAADEAVLIAAAVKYGRAIVHVVEVFRRVRDRARHPIEIEVCVDETAEVTSLVEHAYIVTELSRLGVPLVSFAPRYSGSFQKAVPYVGDLEAFKVDFARHAYLARTLGPYKLSLHSGSDKFELYEMAFAATEGAVHLKTSGTSYLEALEVVAEHDPGLLREIYRISRGSYTASSKSYQVVADVALTPEPGTVVDSAAIELLRNNQTRQILHVGYGEILGAEAGSSENQVADGIRQVLEARSDEYASRLERHFVRHLTPFGITA
jgi:hypothetical protein